MMYTDSVAFMDDINLRLANGRVWLNGVEILKPHSGYCYTFNMANGAVCVALNDVLVVNNNGVETVQDLAACHVTTGRVEEKDIDSIIEFSNVCMVNYRTPLNEYIMDYGPGSEINGQCYVVVMNGVISWYDTEHQIATIASRISL